MSFHKHSTLDVGKLKDSSLQMECTTCGEKWTSNFQYYVQSDAWGNITDRGILQSSTQTRIACDKLDGANRQKNEDFVTLK